MNNILTTSGYKNLEDVLVGEEVVAYDMNSGESLVNTIIRKEYINVQSYVAYTINDKINKIGSEIVQLKSGIYKTVNELLVGDIIIKNFNKEILIDSISINVEKSINTDIRFFKINDKYVFFGLNSVWRNDNQVVHIKDLVINDIIFSDTNENILITSIEEVYQNYWYKLEISGDHSYIVDGLTLHNASRFWVGSGSSTNWNATANTNWSASSGGANNASVPTSADVANFDTGSANSTLSASQSVSSLIMVSGYTGTLTHSAAVTLTIAGGNGTGSGSTGSCFTITSNYVIGNSVTSVIAFNASSVTAGTYFNGITCGNINITGSLIDLHLNTSLVSTGTFTINEGTFTTHDNNMSILVLDVFANSNSVTLTLGASTITITGSDSDASSANLFRMGADPDSSPPVTINKGTSTFKFTNNTANTKTINSGGNTLYNIWISGSGTYTLFSLTCNDFKVDTPPRTIRLTAGTTLTASSFTLLGTAGNLISLISVTSGVFATISKSSGTVTFDYVFFKDIHATGGATFTASLCTNTNVSGNAGITFSVCGGTSTGNMFLFFD